MLLLVCLVCLHNAVQVQLLLVGAEVFSQDVRLVAADQRGSQIRRAGQTLLRLSTTGSG